MEPCHHHDDGLPSTELRSLSRDALVRRIEGLRADLVTVTHERDQALTVAERRRLEHEELLSACKALIDAMDDAINTDRELDASVAEDTPVITEAREFASQRSMDAMGVFVRLVRGAR